MTNKEKKTSFDFLKDKKKFFQVNHIVCVCRGPRCSARGSITILKAFEEELGVPSGEKTPNEEFALETVYCLGLCEMGPNVLVDEEHYGEMSSTQVTEVLKKYMQDNKVPLLIKAICPFCQKSLAHPTIPESIQVQGSFQNHKELIALKVFSDRIHLESDHSLESQKIVWSCPHCKMPLEDGGHLCELCHSDVVGLETEDKGSFWFCCRIKCGKYGWK